MWIVELNEPNYCWELHIGFGIPVLEVDKNKQPVLDLFQHEVCDIGIPMHTLIVTNFRWKDMLPKIPWN